MSDLLQTQVIDESQPRADTPISNKALGLTLLINTVSKVDKTRPI